MERAADVMEKMEVKVKKASGKEKLFKERAKAWEEINGGIVVIKSANAFDVLEFKEREERDEWVSDEEMEEMEEGKEGKLREVGVAEDVMGVDGVEVAVPKAVPPPPVSTMVEEEEIL